MLKLSFNQTKSEIMVRAASTIIFNSLVSKNYPIISISDIAENPQYGFTASASFEPTGIKFIRITDLQDGGINWDTVPYCECNEPQKYLLQSGDILFARTGATTGKTHLVKKACQAVFASYLIRLRPKNINDSQYLYSFFQSDNYWLQIADKKEGSAQSNVNGKKLINIKIPLIEDNIKEAISEFLEVVRRRQDGSKEDLPPLPHPLEEQQQIVAKVEELAGKIEEVRWLRDEALRESEALLGSEKNSIFNEQYIKQVEIYESEKDKWQLKAFVIFKPPIEKQQEIVTYLDNLQSKINEIKQLREKAIQELDALLPSILDKAFKGEL